MNIELKLNDATGYLIFKDEQVEIRMELVFYDAQKKWHIPDSTISQFLKMAHQCSRFNKVTDVEFVKKIYDLYLEDREQTQFVETLIDKKVALVGEFVEYLKLHEIEVPENVFVGFF